MGTQWLGRVVGLTFRPAYPENLHRLAEAMKQEQVDEIRNVSDWNDIDNKPEGPAVVLIRDANNPKDPNAIQVHVPSMGRDGWIGFIPKELAERWAPRLDHDPPPVVEASVTGIPIDPLHLDRPGIEILVRIHDQGCGLGDGWPCSCSKKARSRATGDDLHPTPEWNG